MTVWSVPAYVVDVIDGDTIKLDLDLGWRIILAGVNCRIWGIDAPEMRTEEGKAARAFAKQLIDTSDEPYRFTSRSLDKYGRPLGDLTLPDGSDFGTLMRNNNHAVEYYGGAR